MDRNFTDTEEAEIAKIYLSGYSARAIARAYKLPGKTSIISALRRQGVKQRSPAERNRLYKVNARAFDIIDNEHKAYWLGFLYADGCVHRRSVSLGLARKDKSHIEKFKLFLESEHPVKNIVGWHDHPQSRLFVTDKNLTNMLREYGILKNRPSYALSINNISKHLHHHWLRGYFDGDGSARRDQSIALCGQQDLLKWIRWFSAKHANTNPELAVTKHKTANIYYLYFSGRIQALKFSKLLYKDATVWLERKRNIINNWRQEMFSIVKGEDNSASKLTEIQVKQIRKRYKDEIISYAQLGREYNITPDMISRIVRRKAWTYLK